MLKVSNNCCSKNQFGTYEFYLGLEVNLLILLIPLSMSFPTLTFELPTFSTDSVFPVKMFSFPSLNSMQLSFLTLKTLTICPKGGVKAVARSISTRSAVYSSSSLSSSVKLSLKYGCSSDWSAFILSSGFTLSIFIKRSFVSF